MHGPSFGRVSYLVCFYVFILVPDQSSAIECLMWVAQRRTILTWAVEDKREMHPQLVPLVERIGISLHHIHWWTNSSPASSSGMGSRATSEGGHCLLKASGGAEETDQRHAFHFMCDGCYIVLPGKVMMYDIAGYRWCENVGRHHKSNNIMWAESRWKCYAYKSLLTFSFSSWDEG